MKEIQVADDKMDADCAGKPRNAHDRNNLHQAPVEFGTSSHEQKQTADRAQSAAETGPVVGNYRDQGRRNAGQGVGVQTDESKIGRNEDRGHPKNSDRDSGENDPNRARPQENSSPPGV